jgi:uncharacterized repeat protein (TIGR03833 family)
MGRKLADAQGLPAFPQNSVGTNASKWIYCPGVGDDGSDLLHISESKLNRTEGGNPPNRITSVESESKIMNVTHQGKVKPGMQVRIVLKKDQRSGKLTKGIVKDILTKSSTHPHGIKVRLENGEVGRVKQIL